MPKLSFGENSILNCFFLVSFPDTSAMFIMRKPPRHGKPFTIQWFSPRPNSVWQFSLFNSLRLIYQTNLAHVRFGVSLIENLGLITIKSFDWSSQGSLWRLLPSLPVEGRLLPPPQEGTAERNAMQSGGNGVLRDLQHVLRQERGLLQTRQRPA